LRRLLYTAATLAACLRDDAGAVIASAVVAALVGGTLASAADPPPSITPSLTPNGRVIWNLDGLLNDTFGDRTDCYDGAHAAIFSVAHGSDCPSPSARYQEYVFTFLNARDSQFHLVKLSKEPFTGVPNSPLLVDGSYVACPGGEYQHGGEGWLVCGGGAGPNGYFWCE
jgi:hypothetical protein